MIRRRYAVILVSACALLLSIGKLRLLAQTIKFEVPAVVDPIHTNGEPDIAIEPSGRIFVSGPTGTGTQRSTWFGSVDRGHTFRIITPGPAPTAITGIIDPPGGGDTDIAFDRSGKQYFADLYALLCVRTATTADGERRYSRASPEVARILGLEPIGSGLPFMTRRPPPCGSRRTAAQPR